MSVCSPRTTKDMYTISMAIAAAPATSPFDSFSADVTGPSTRPHTRAVCARQRRAGVEVAEETIRVMSPLMCGAEGRV